LATQAITEPSVPQRRNENTLPPASLASIQAKPPGELSWLYSAGWSR
jgi:hypothetical protein